MDKNMYCKYLTKEHSGTYKLMLLIIQNQQRKEGLLLKITREITTHKIRMQWLKKQHLNNCKEKNAILEKDLCLISSCFSQIFFKHTKSECIWSNIVTEYDYIIHIETRCVHQDWNPSGGNKNVRGFYFHVEHEEH